MSRLAKSEKQVGVNYLYSYENVLMHKMFRVYWDNIVHKLADRVQQKLET